jgi:uncharacterized protein YjbI with pentapeptide repeats
MTETSEALQERRRPETDVSVNGVSGVGTKLPVPFAEKATDLQALRDAVVDAAGVGAGLWLSYLFALFYLLVAAAGVSHRDLLFENPIKLPFLAVDLPLKGFFWLGPALFVVMHAYVLLHLVLLSGKIGVFAEELSAQVNDADVRTCLRRQLPSNIFVQFLAGPREVRTGLMGFMLRLVAWVSLAVGPVLLLVCFQLQFLPYHDALITWWHRIAISCDLALLWMFWPAVVRGQSLSFAWRGMRRGTICFMVLLTLLPLMLILTIATFPGEWADGFFRSVLFAWPRRVLVAGKVDFASRRLDSLWSNVIVLPGVDLKGNNQASAALDKAGTQSVSLRARHLERAVLIGASLPNVDFSAAKLQGARLEFADLRGAQFDCASAEPSWRAGIPELEGRFVDTTNGPCSQLQGASFLDARLQGASFDGASLEGANFNWAHLEGASLKDAHAQGAWFVRAKLQCAFVPVADLRAADFTEADLEAAWLAGAKLQGARFVSAELAGATLEPSTLDGTDLQGARVWRADPFFRPYVGSLALVTNVSSAAPHATDPSAFVNLRSLVEEEVPSGGARDRALRAARRLDDPSEGWSSKFGSRLSEVEAAQAWQALQDSNPTAEQFARARLEQWARVGCAEEGAPYVALHLLRDILQPRNARRLQPGKGPSEWRTQLARKFLRADCAGARNIDEDARRELRETRDGKVQ